MKTCNIRSLFKAVSICFLLAAIAWLPAVSRAQTDCGLLLPDNEITMTVRANEYLSCSQILGKSSYLDTTLSGIGPGFSLENSVYPGFCASLEGDILDSVMFGASYQVRLYSSLNPPSHLQAIPWDQINYILNNKTTFNANWLEIQAAMWTVVHGCQPSGDLWNCPPLREFPFPFGPSAPYGCPPYGTAPDVNLTVVANIVAAAQADGPGFIPGKGQSVAVIVDPVSCSGTQCNNYPDMQVTIIETTCIKGSIGDYVWNDQNQNGIQDDGEPGIPDVTVKLFECGPDGLCGTADDTGKGQTTTNADGYYLFDNLPEGTYCVKFEAPEGFVFTVKEAPDSTPENDSNANAAGLTQCIDLGPGEDNLTIDAGLFKPEPRAALGDFVWEDLNGNGIQDGGEPGIQGVSVFLYLCGPDGLCGSSDDIFAAQTQTDDNGQYMFDDLVPGKVLCPFRKSGWL
jgi:hypothetical protein